MVVDPVLERVETFYGGNVDAVKIPQPVFHRVVIFVVARHPASAAAIRQRTAVVGNVGRTHMLNNIPTVKKSAGLAIAVAAPVVYKMADVLVVGNIGGQIPQAVNLVGESIRNRAGLSTLQRHLIEDGPKPGFL